MKNFCRHLGGRTTPVCWTSLKPSKHSETFQVRSNARFKQECIPVGCVLSAVVAMGGGGGDCPGVCLPRRVLAQGGVCLGMSANGGGVYHSMHRARGCIPACTGQGEGVSAQGSAQGEGTVGSGVCVSQHALASVCWDTCPPTVDRILDICL